ncbi:uncharacterized protein LOC126576434 [Anopheles aquasalis]|uniref:uncharacterized protein LOC126576434 n=1 Tax=Anopheles aquasalis TaxID=42839 RepID=UPI00215A10A3|nr:uncharacterized protein LOC126576434 [Anopheles aquasalis]
MGDDVICIESDEDDEEADDEAGSSRAPRTPRGVRGGGKRERQQNRSASTGGGYWRQRRIARAARRKRDLNGGGIGEQSTVAWLQGELQRLRCAGPRKSDPQSVRCALACQVVHRVRELVQEFQCRTVAAGTGSTSAAIDSCRPSTERTKCWRHVLQFLLRTSDTGPYRKFDPTIGSLHRWQQQQQQQHQQQDICDDQASNSTVKEEEQVRCEHRRYQLTVIDILVDYIRFRCEEMVAQVATVATVAATTATQPSTSASARLLLAECNRIVSALFVIFDGDMEPVTLTLLHLDTTDRRYTLLLYPLFESILRHPGASGLATIKATEQQTGDGGRTASARSWISCPTIPCYVRVLLCFQRWKALVSSRADRAVIEGYAVQLMPARCPTVQLTADVAFLRLLPAVPAVQRTSETRFLLASEGLFELDQCIGQYMNHYRWTFCKGGGGGGGDGSVPSPSLATISDVPSSPFRLSKHRNPAENESNYINVRLLAELIERKSGLWCAEHERGQREQEVDSLVNAVRLIFRNRVEFCELTLLQIPRLGRQPVMAGVFEALLTPQTAHSSPETATGRSIYRWNDVETYGRLMLCYAKWKTLYRWLEDDGELTREWARIDAIALSQLPNDFPRSICPRDVLLRRILRPKDGDAGLLSMSQRQRQSTTPTRFFLQTLPERADLQELCYKFLDASRCHPDGTSPMVELRERHDTHLPSQTSIAYQSLESIIGSSSSNHRAGSSATSLAASAWPTLQPRNSTIVDAELTRTEMKPIIIPDSGTDGRGSALPLSVSGNTAEHLLVHLPFGSAKSTLVCEPTTHHNTYHQSITTGPAPEVQTPKSFVVYDATQPTSGCGDEPPGNSGQLSASIITVLDGDGALALGPELAECFLNTPPATPQQQHQHQQQQQQEVLPSELLVVEEDRNRNVAPEQHAQTGCRLARLKGTLEAIPSRRRRSQRPPAATALTARRPLGKRRARRGRGQRRSKQAVHQWPSIMRIGCIPTTEMTLSGTDATREDRSKDELLLELIGGLEEEETVGQQPDIDFTILADGETVEHLAPPSTLIDTSASIFGTEGQSDAPYVLLFTEPDGPFCWPVSQ